MPRNKRSIIFNVKETLIPDFEAQVTAALMIQSNALIPIKLAVRLCGISRQEIDRRVHNGTFPTPTKLSDQSQSIRKAFYLRDIQAWMENPREYRCAVDAEEAKHIDDSNHYDAP